MEQFPEAGFIRNNLVVLFLEEFTGDSQLENHPGNVDSIAHRIGFIRLVSRLKKLNNVIDSIDSI